MHPSLPTTTRMSRARSSREDPYSDAARRPRVGALFQARLRLRSTSTIDQDTCSLLIRTTSYQLSSGDLRVFLKVEEDERCKREWADLFLAAWLKDLDAIVRRPVRTYAGRKYRSDACVCMELIGKHRALHTHDIIYLLGNSFAFENCR